MDRLAKRIPVDRLGRIATGYFNRSDEMGEIDAS
jgi:hypothetical protein